MQPSKSDWRQNGYGLLSTKAGSWIFSRILHIADKTIFNISGGKQTAITAIAGLPSIMMTTIGAKSGEPRTTPLIGIPDGENFIIVASNFGKKNHPAWYYNVTANPDVTVTINGEAKSYKARRVEGAERERCWNKAAGIYPGYNDYQERAGRDIGVFLLEPQNK